MADKDTMIAFRTRLTNNLKQIIEWEGNNVDDVTSMEEVEVRLTRLETLFVDFQRIENDLFSKFPDTESTSMEFENDFFDIKSKLLRHLRDRQKSKGQIPTDNLSSVLNSMFVQQKQFLDTVHNTTTLNDKSFLNDSVRLPKVSIEKFDGNYRNWPSFEDAFKSAVHTNDSLSKVTKFRLLKMLLADGPVSIIKNMLETDANYDAAWEKLLSRYKKSKFILTSYISTFLDMAPATSGKAADMRSLSDKSDELLMGIRTIGVSAEARDGWIIQILLRKLDSKTRQEWTKDTVDTEFPTITEFLNWLNIRCDGLDHSQFLNVGTQEKTNKPARGSSIRSMATSSNGPAPASSSTSNPCPFCKRTGHGIIRCIKYRFLKPLARRSWALENSLCENCLRSGHSAESCSSETNCRHCNQRHNSLIHQFASSSSTQSHTNSSAPSNPPLASSRSSSSASDALKNVIHSSVISTNSSHTHSHSLRSALIKSTTEPRNSPLPTALVKIKNRFNSYDLARVLLDSGSQTSFITEQLVHRLGLQRRNSSSIVSGLGNKKTVSTKGVTQLILSSRFNAEQAISVLAHIVPTILTLNPTEIEFFDFSSLKLADPNYGTAAEIDVLLGSDVFFDIIQPERVIINGQTHAQDTIFGWVVLAPNNDNSSNLKNLSTMIFDDILNDTMQRFWEVEEPPSCSKQSPVDQECETLYQLSVSRTNSGRYSVGLPFRSPLVSLGHSKTAAFKRLMSMERRFNQDADLAKEYRKFMREYIELDHMELVPPHELNKPDKKIFYLPHHAVRKTESTSTKLRVVFDGSCRTSSGSSLNDALLVGPTLQPDLITVITRFRRHQIAISADIEKMYRQILIQPQHGDYQRVLWRDDPKQDVKTYRLKTVTYGTSSASYLAVRTLFMVADTANEKYPTESDIIRHDFYVDDLLSGTNDVVSAVTISQNLIRILSESGFPLRKWKSNSTEFLASLQPHQKDPSCLDLSDDNLTKTLGIQWDPVRDCFCFKVDTILFTLNPTKRQLLSHISTIFDPLGWLSPTTILLKILMQSLWLTNLDWDDALPDNIRCKWLEIKDGIDELSKIQIPRKLFPPNHIGEIQIHGFCDASERAYAGVVYVRSIDTNGKVNVSLLVAKTKVAPLKQVSLPRLELCGAVLLVNLIKFATTTLKDYQHSIFAWTDSNVVLSWLSDFPGKWKSYVGNRTSYILETVPRNHWHHVRSKQNPADCSSRGIMPHELPAHKLWWAGPEWLQLPLEAWPLSTCETTNENVPERRIKVLVCKTSPLPIDLSTIDKMLQWKSSFSKLCRIFAYVLRLHPAFGKLPFIQRVRKAETIFIRFVQQLHFSTETRNLQEKLPISRRSHLQSLSPFIDGEGILRVGGRLENLNCPFEMKHPIILPSNYFLTDVIVREYHLKNLHPSSSLLLSLIRQRFWVIHGRKVVRNMKCVRCHRFKQNISSQLMGQLPRNRITEGRPFLKTGVDYAGPIQIRQKVGRGRLPLSKGYLSLFICLATKAVHIEVVSELSSEAYIAALRRFVGRRGYPEEVVSDNGTNFVGAARELRELHQLVLDDTNNSISSFFSEKMISFSFNPASAPHFGGLWEANIKSIKAHIKKVTNEAPMTFEEWLTLTTQIEALLNSRPLCPMSENPDDYDFLTPGHFLIGGPLVSIPGPDLEDIPTSRLSRWQAIEKRAKSFWKRWSSDYLHHLQQRTKWTTEAPNLAVGDVVLVKEDNLPPTKWLLARIIQLHPGSDNLVRVATIKTKNGELKRPIVKLSRLPLDSFTNQPSDSQ